MFFTAVAHASLFIQNISLTACSILLMLVFSYKKWIEQIWNGWLTVSNCYGFFTYLYVLHVLILVYFILLSVLLIRIAVALM